MLTIKGDDTGLCAVFGSELSPVSILVVYSVTVRSLSYPHYRQLSPYEPVSCDSISHTDLDFPGIQAYGLFG